jgi:hypothetical protein
MTTEGMQLRINSPILGTAVAAPAASRSPTDQSWTRQ